MANDGVADDRDEYEAKVGANPAVRRAACHERQKEIRGNTARSRRNDCGAEMLELRSSETARSLPFSEEQNNGDYPNSQKVKEEQWIEGTGLPL